MLSRILWVALAGLALVGGIIFQNGGVIGFEHGSDIARDRIIDASVDGAIQDRIAERMTVVRVDGSKVEVSRETKKDLGKAVSELVAAKTQLALLKARGADEADVLAAERRSDRADAEVERLQAQIEGQKNLSRGERDALRTQIQQEVRQTVRDSIRG